MRIALLPERELKQRLSALTGRKGAAVALARRQIESELQRRAAGKPLKPPSGWRDPRHRGFRKGTPGASRRPLTENNPPRQ